MISFLQNLLDLMLEAAPWLVLGLALGGLMKALIPTAFLQQHLSGHGIGAVIKAALLGAPLPLCSCGVIPAALGLRKAGASKPATASFLVSTPETGIDSISITYALLGPFMAVVRPLAALLSAFTAGMLVAVFDPEEEAVRKKASANKARNTQAGAAPSCCSTEPVKPGATNCCEALAAPHTSGSLDHAVSAGCSAPTKPDRKPDSDCCSVKPHNQPLTNSACCETENSSVDEKSCCSANEVASSAASCCSGQTEAVGSRWLNKAWGGIRYAFTQLLDDIVIWLVVGLIFAALVKTFLPVDFLAQWGSGITAMLVMMLAGIPMYICATASTPVAAGLMLAGISPGVALVLLLTGPATNISTLGVIRQQLGGRSMWLYLLAVGTTAIAAGVMTDWVVDAWQIDIAIANHLAHEGAFAGLQWVALLLLTGVVAWRRFAGRSNNL